MKKILLTLLAISTIGQAREKRPIVIVSVHKCGTHLVAEAVSQFTGYKVFWPGYVRGQDLDASLEQMGEDRFMMIHVPYLQEVADIMQKHHAIVIFVYRDPRDYVVSFAYFRLHWAGTDGKPNVDLAKTITDLITTFVAPWYADSTNVKGAASVFDAMLGWRQYPNVCIVRFEDLVGERGGGSAVTQHETLVQLANHLGIEYTEETIATVAQNIFGNGVTFREGKIGSWKKHFTAQDIELCKLNCGQLLIDLGYETDLNW